MTQNFERSQKRLKLKLKNLFILQSDNSFNPLSIERLTKRGIPITKHALCMAIVGFVLHSLQLRKLFRGKISSSKSNKPYEPNRVFIPQKTIKLFSFNTCKNNGFLLTSDQILLLFSHLNIFSNTQKLNKIPMSLKK